MCKVTWCSNNINENSHWTTKYCDIHKEYKTYGKNAPVRPWLFYKTEKIMAGDLKCESCGYDPRHYFPNRDLKTLSGLFDVDHINSNLKHTPEGEKPSNYQLVCKSCHILKSYDEGDYIRKDFR